MNSDPLAIVSGLKGVIRAFYLDQEIMEQVREEEAKVKASGNITVVNEGFNQALKRQHVICIVKDPRFRPPPEPTVILISNTGQVMGIEVFPHTAKQYQDRTDVLWLSDGFVVFTDVIPEEHGDEFFLMPPIPFPELNEGNGCKDVISCSPAPTCDRMIRQRYGMEDDGRLASILVAFNEI